MSYAYLFKYIIIGDTGESVIDTLSILCTVEWMLGVYSRQYFVGWSRESYWYICVNEQVTNNVMLHMTELMLLKVTLISTVFSFPLCRSVFVFGLTPKRRITAR
jgi:hypothetical protein